MKNTHKSFFRRIEELLSLASGVFMTLFILVLLEDIVSFLNSPDDYIRVYHLDTSKQNWQLDYLSGSFLTLGCLLAGLILYFLTYKNRQITLWKYIRTAVTLVLFVSMAFGFYQW